MSKTKLSASEYKRKLEHQIYLAQEHPAKIYDLTDCNINQIPRGVFTYCKVLRKYSLNLSENNLNSLDSGGNLEELSYLGALILTKNSFKLLPNDFSKLINLKKLFIDFNKLQKFPAVLTELPNLKMLNLSGNSIKIIPKEVKNFKSLENLNITKNPLNIIAPEICEIKSIKILKINLENIKNVSVDILRNGIEAVWVKFCEIRQVPFRKINNFIERENLEYDNLLSDENSDIRYTKIGDEIEREIMEHEQVVSIVENEDRRKSLNEIKRKIQIENEIISEILTKKQHDNDRLLNAIQYEEINTNELINKIFEFNNKAKKKEELRNRIAERNVIYNELNLTNESKNEILNSMKQLLQSTTDITRNSQNLTLVNNKPCNEDFVIYQNIEQWSLEQDIEQKLAYKQLQFEKDPQLARLRDGMEIIEKKLQQLSVEDMIKGYLATDFNRNNRTHLVDVLNELKLEKESREKILDSKINEMENSRMKEQKDFWIAQYQTLLDDKAKCDFEVEELLKMANMEEWTHVFLNNNYTIDMMLDLTMNDMDQLQIKPDYVKSKFLAFLNEWKFNPFKSEKNSQPSAPSMLLSEYEKNNSELVVPSAPPLNSSIYHDAGNHCQENTVVMARKEAECCICLTLEARILLLNCGHVCCCQECSLPIKQCPLCRQVIVQRVNLEFSI